MTDKRRGSLHDGGRAGGDLEGLRVSGWAVQADDRRKGERTGARVWRRLGKHRWMGCRRNSSLRIAVQPLSFFFSLPLVAPMRLGVWVGGGGGWAREGGGWYVRSCLCRARDVRATGSTAQTTRDITGSSGRRKMPQCALLGWRW